MFSKKRLPLWRGLTCVSLSLVAICTIGYGIADTWRSKVDSVLGTTSFVTNTKDAKYVSSYATGDEVMKANKAFSVKEGAEGTVIMKNDNSVFPLAKQSKVALFGSAAYNTYMSAAGNTDQVSLAGALTDAGFSVNSTLKAIYDKLGTFKETIGSGWFSTTTYKYGPNKSAGDYLENGYQIVEANPDTDFTGDGGGAANWKESVQGTDYGVVVLCRPGGEGTTYRPGIARDSQGNTLDQNPLALSPDELKVIETAKGLCSKVVVLLNTSCTMEIGPLVSGTYGVDGIAYIGIPNDYQFTGIVQALDGDVNPSGALADTYATSSTSSPAMMNFGGGYYSDHTIVAADGTNYSDPRYPGQVISNNVTGSFGGSASYSGGYYIAEAEGIYTGYSYYETRYYDSILKQGNASSAKGSSQGGNWDYSKEVLYPFGYGQSYLTYEQSLTKVEVENKAGGNINATISIKNTGTKAGTFLGQLYVQSPYTDYDKTNKVEKSAIQFLTSGKVEVGAGETKEVNVTIPTKYIASYDYTTAKTYILDGGTYYFATGNGSHEAVNNILAVQNKTGDAAGDKNCVKTWDNGSESETDITTFAVSDSGAKITNTMDNADLNYYLPGTVTYLSRSDWDGTYPINYNTVNDGKGVTLSNSSKKDEWIKSLRNQDYNVKTDEPVTNVNGTDSGERFTDIGYDAQNDINNEYWEKLVNGISADQAVGAVAHGGSQSDALTNVDNPVVTQNDGPNGFNNKALSTNNGTKGEDRYYVDPDTEAGKFKTAINSETLMGSAFNPALAEEWGELMGNDGLWIGNYQIWGAALNYHRSPYNGRNTEYPSEDPMLCNVIGVGITKGTRKFGIISGPKHIGFNDQEHDRSGLCVYLNEQKIRETDLRGFEGSVEEGGALGLMVAFNRLGAINASHNTGLLKGIIRGEWGFNGLISTDMMNNKYYFNPESSTIATVTQMADFAGNNSTVAGGEGGVDATWGYLSLDVIKNDATLVKAAREAMKFQLYAFANSAILNVSTTQVVPSWEQAIKVGIGVTSGLSVVTGGLWIATTLLWTAKRKEEK